MEKLQTACGVFGCVTVGEWPTTLDLSGIICYGLIALQHRGQESAGIAVSDGHPDSSPKCKRGMGLVSNIFDTNSLLHLSGNLGIGHTRYSTCAASDLEGCQPYVVQTSFGSMTVAHNGELVNAQQIKAKMLKEGYALRSGSDSELITHLLAQPLGDEETSGRPDFVARFHRLAQETQTAYSLLLMHGDCIYAMRDPFGNRPLCAGRLLSRPGFLSNDASPVSNSSAHSDPSMECEGWLVASESCALHTVGAVVHRELLPGEVVCLSRSGISSLDVVARLPQPHRSLSAPSAAFCIFEYVYFARPDSRFENQSVYSVRERCGRQLAIEAPVDADIVSTVPESATPAALGFARQSGLPYVEVLSKNRYVGRTFIQPSMRLRQLGVATKFGPISDNLVGRRVVLIDDSIVRGNTMGPIVKLLRSVGATEVHIRIASPPLKYPCYMGINIPTKHELIANQMDTDQLAKYIGADSIVYLSLEGLVASVTPAERSGHCGVTNGFAEAAPGSHDAAYYVAAAHSGYCTACLSGHYPVEL